MKITVLGSGTSHGVPFIGCECAVCRSTDVRDKRLRASILIDLGARVSGLAVADAVRYVLVDTSPDLRQQALTHNMKRVDAIVFTHAHADHVCGFDDIRRFNTLQQTPMACFGSADTLADLRRMFSYVFKPPKQAGGGLPKVNLFPLGGPFSLGGPGGVVVVPVPVMHGLLPVLGLRIGSFAYLTDCNRIPDTSWPLLDGVQTVIVDALRHRPHSTHFNVDDALAFVTRLGATRAYFTHISHDLGHADTCAQLPRGVELAYDGQVIEIDR